MNFKSKALAQLKIVFDKKAEELQETLSDKTPVDTKDLKNSLTTIDKTPFEKHIVYKDVDYAKEVEYGQGVEMNYNLENFSTVTGIGAGMIRKTIDEYEAGFR